MDDFTQTTAAKILSKLSRTLKIPRHFTKFLVGICKLICPCFFLSMSACPEFNRSYKTALFYTIFMMAAKSLSKQPRKTKCPLPFYKFSWGKLICPCWSFLMSACNSTDHMYQTALLGRLILCNLYDDCKNLVKT